jgi:hypothetical protein
LSITYAVCEHLIHSKVRDGWAQPLLIWINAHLYFISDRTFADQCFYGHSFPRPLHSLGDLSQRRQLEAHGERKRLRRFSVSRWTEQLLMVCVTPGAHKFLQVRCTKCGRLPYEVSLLLGQRRLA